MGQRNEEHHDSDDNVDDLRRCAYLVLQRLAAVDQAAEQKSCENTANRRTGRDQTDRQPVKTGIFKCRQRGNSMGRVAGYVKRCRQPSDGAGDQHGMQDIPIHINPRKFSRKPVGANGPQFEALCSFI